MWVEKINCSKGLLLHQMAKNAIALPSLTISFYEEDNEVLYLHSTYSNRLRLRRKRTLYQQMSWAWKCWEQFEKFASNIAGTVSWPVFGNMLLLMFTLFTYSKQSTHQKFVSLLFPIADCRGYQMWFFFYFLKQIATILPRICSVISSIEFIFLNKYTWKIWNWLLFNSILSQIWSYQPLDISNIL